MQRATQRPEKAEPDPDRLVSISEAARQTGRDKSTLSRQIKKGLIRSHGSSKVRVSEVRADHRANVAWRVAATPRGMPVQSPKAVNAAIENVEMALALLDERDALYVLEFCLVQQVSFIDGGEPDGLTFDEGETITLNVVRATAGAIEAVILPRLRQRMAAARGPARVSPGSRPTAVGLRTIYGGSDANAVFTMHPKRAGMHDAAARLVRLRAALRGAAALNPDDAALADGLDGGLKPAAARRGPGRGPGPGQRTAQTRLRIAERDALLRAAAGYFFHPSARPARPGPWPWKLPDTGTPRGSAGSVRPQSAQRATLARCGRRRGRRYGSSIARLQLGTWSASWVNAATPDRPCLVVTDARLGLLMRWKVCDASGSPISAT